MSVNGAPRAVVFECNRRCGTRFVREVHEGESDRDAQARAVWDANVVGWREMRGRGLRCGGCFARYGHGEEYEVTTTLHAALAALYDCARKCDVCEDHARTRRGEGHGETHKVCDRDECGHAVRCLRCGGIDEDQPLAGRVCPFCGHRESVRVPRSASWADLPHADALRAANAAHEARR